MAYAHRSAAQPRVDGSRAAALGPACLHCAPPQDSADLGHESTMTDPSIDRPRAAVHPSMPPATAAPCMHRCTSVLCPSSRSPDKAVASIYLVLRPGNACHCHCQASMCVLG